jgi:hypothetical protein|uniref:cDNA FLJ45139 fis, clone BRAWH3039623 n=1 Tax=Homo sapiens TaxID=9606 RepID=Q6ZSX8_HUMAN|nr:unnamed protein product [Homo sapiens]
MKKRFYNAKTVSILLVKQQNNWAISSQLHHQLMPNLESIWLRMEKESLPRSLNFDHHGIYMNWQTKFMLLLKTVSIPRSQAIFTQPGLGSGTPQGYKQSHSALGWAATLSCWGKDGSRQLSWVTAGSSFHKSDLIS